MLTLAIGIAGPTAMFSMIKFWILEPLPFAHPDTLVDLRYIDTSTGNYGGINPADFLDWSRSTRTLAELARTTRTTTGSRAATGPSARRARRSLPTSSD